MVYCYSNAHFASICNSHKWIMQMYMRSDIANTIHSLHLSRASSRERFKDLLLKSALNKSLLSTLKLWHKFSTRQSWSTWLKKFPSSQSTSHWFSSVSLLECVQESLSRLNVASNIIKSKNEKASNCCSWCMHTKKSRTFLYVRFFHLI